ncbi:(2Fe-2S)-binding protein [Neptunomonas sp. XY-337]|uniref:(2Fe-2S)-binding protein n=1 Tax=Neptunomonas sp. XY-337 TaxID=2561897 RepID=UPI0010A99948|nr:(2Fe-2S)-binding protein [Neptunomonas sp. XY-337]
MNEDRKLADPTLVCTCNALYVCDIVEAIDIGEDDYREILALHGLQPRCGECRPHVEALVSEH